jgi:hypothetical protein
MAHAVADSDVCAGDCSLHTHTHKHTNTHTHTQTHTNTHTQQRTGRGLICRPASLLKKFRFSCCLLLKRHWFFDTEHIQYFDIAQTCIHTHTHTHMSKHIYAYIKRTKLCTPDRTNNTCPYTHTHTHTHLRRHLSTRTFAQHNTTCERAIDLPSLIHTYIHA